LDLQIGRTETTPSCALAFAYSEGLNTLILKELMSQGLIGLLGVLLGVVLTALFQKGFNKNSFIERQIECLYSPLLGIREEIKAKDKIRSDISNSSANGKNDDLFSQGIEYDNSQLRDEIMPAYERMIQIMRDNNWLAEESTRKYLPLLIKVVEVWKRDHKKVISNQVRLSLPHSDKDLQGFYDDLEYNLKVLRSKVKKG